MSVKFLRSIFATLLLAGVIIACGNGLNPVSGDGVVQNSATESYVINDDFVPDSPAKPSYTIAINDDFIPDSPAKPSFRV